MKFRYAIFDMDGLMFDTEHLFVESFKTEVSRVTGMEFPEKKLKEMLGLNYKDTQETFPRLFGSKYTCDQCYEIGDRWVREYIEANGLPVKAGLVDLLKWLKKFNLRIALATSSKREKALRYIEMTGIQEFFDVVIGGDMVTRGKPDPQIFYMAAEAMGAGNFDECVVFEDSKNGLLAASGAGMAAIIVPDIVDPTAEHPGLCYAKVSRLDEAIVILKSS